VPEQTAEQRFGPTSGVITGWAGVVLATLVGVGVAVEDPSVTGFGVAALVLALGVLAWCFLLRPRVLIRGEQLVLRNAFTDQLIPLCAVEDIVVRQTTVVATDDGVYRGIGVGRPLRKIIKERAGERRAHGAERATPQRTSLDTAEVPDFMIEQVLARKAHAAGSAEEPPHLEYAVPELVLLAVLLLLFLLLAVL
jgi:hypothetical protein